MIGTGNLAETEGQQVNEIYELTIQSLRKSFDTLWQAIQDGKYNSRSVLADELLNMKDAFDDFDRHLTAQSSKWEVPRCDECHLPDPHHLGRCSKGNH